MESEGVLCDLKGARRRRDLSVALFKRYGTM